MSLEAAPCSIFASSIVGEAPLAQNTSSLGMLWSHTLCPATSGGGEGGVEGRGGRDRGGGGGGVEGRGGRDRGEEEEGLRGGGKR